MKKLIFLIFVVFLFSCKQEKKEDKFCWICEIQLSYSNKFMKMAREQESDSYVARCHLTETEIKEYEKANNRIEYDSGHGLVFIECMCRKDTIK
jgi:hypothetical protein